MDHTLQPFGLASRGFFYLNKHLKLVEYGYSPEFDVSDLGAVFDVECLPAMNRQRRAARAESRLILDERRKETEPGYYEPVRLSVDPLTAAERVYRAASVEEETAAAGNLRLNSLRALAEAYSKYEAEYFPPIRQTFRRGIGFEAAGMALIEVCTNGLNPADHPEEQQRRINERVQAATYDAFHDSPIKDSHWLLTFKPCPDYAKVQSAAGYVPQIDKLFIEGAHFGADGDPDSLAVEVLAIPGRRINVGFLNNWLKEQEVNLAEPLASSGFTGLQLAVDKSEFANVIELIQELDEKAGDGVFLGEDQLVEPVYDLVVERSYSRLELLEPYAVRLDEFTMDLLASEYGRPWTAVQHEHFVNELLHEIAAKDPERARVMFGAAAAEEYRRALELDTCGEFSEAANMRTHAREVAEPAAFCGAGSCGLVAASLRETVVGRSLGLDALDEIIRDLQRRCPRCSKNTVLYDKYGNKACGNCRNRRVKSVPKPDKPRRRGKQAGQI